MSHLLARCDAVNRPLGPFAALAALLPLLCGLWWSVAARAADAPRPPNIVILLADDLGYADVGFHGCRDIPTPHIDALAAGGVRCTQAYVTGPYCSPTRAGLLTGRYQNRFGHEFNPGPAGSGLPVTETTLADRLQAAGYVTGLVGKWHLGGQPRLHPQKRGFTEFYGFLGGAHPYFPGQGTSLLRGDTPLREEEYLTDAIARESAAFIDRHQKRPFLLYMSFNAVHTPMHADDARLKKFAAIENANRRTYAAMLSALDDAVGSVMAKLQAAGLDENTLVFFFSDNGGPTMPGTTLNASSNAPLRGSKRTTLEGGIRVPMVVWWKGRLPAGKQYPHPVIQLDVLPTALAAAGVPLPADAKLDGVSLLPHLLGESSQPPHATLYWRFGQQMAIRHGDYKLVRYDGTVDNANAAGPRGVVGPRLYHLGRDLGEKDDLAEREPDKVRELQALWNTWNEQLVPPLWGAGAPAAGKKKQG